jgi:methionyl-tRNA synthetase
MLELIDDLTNWFIRRSRRRFWAPGVDADKKSAYATLHYVLVQTLKLLAPAAPIIAEAMYANLAPGESIHLQAWPVIPESCRDDALIAETDAARHLVHLGMRLRQKHQIGIRQPLATLDFVLPGGMPRGAVDGQLAIIAEELNVKQVVQREDVSSIATTRFVPDFKQLGPVLGKDMPQVAAAIKAGNVHFEGSQVVVKQGERSWTIDASMVQIQFEGVEGHDVMSDGGLVVALETAITPELLSEGDARELVRNIQDMRKDADYAISDRIVVQLDGPAPHEWLGYIMDEVLGTLGSVTKPDREKQIEVSAGLVTARIQRDTAKSAAARDRIPAVSKFFPDRERPAFPMRAVVTGGMPYGNKDLHFGHIGGVFIHADCCARFLRDRIGNENVIFVSGTDCYGSPIVADHAAKVATGTVTGSIEEFVLANHKRQKATLDAYAVSPNLFAASALEPAQGIHQALGAEILKTLHTNGFLVKRTTPQFYDATRETFLNGRQVLGRCPIAGCSSEKAYADECSLGHQYEPKELIAPKSTLTGETPEMRDVTNWYVPLDKFGDALRPWLEVQGALGEWREFAVKTVLEYFEPPMIHVNREQLEAPEAAEVVAQLPPHERIEGAAKTASDKFVFKSLEDMDAAAALFGKARIKYRTGKTLVPFRLTGNLAWSLPAPEIDGLKNLTFWVWPESLWAPISFCSAYLQTKRGKGPDAWKQWWCSPEAKLYQFIGEDNLFFYGLAQEAIFLGMQGKTFACPPPEGQLQMSRLVANRHLLFLDKKASSSGKVKPPMAAELLEHYSADQLRFHFLSLALGARNANFRPKPYDPEAANNPRAVDPVLKDGNLGANAFNTAVRSVFYTAQKYYESQIPAGDVSEDVLRTCEAAILDYEARMAQHETPSAIKDLDVFISGINSRWNQAKPFAESTDDAVRRRAVIDAFHMVRVAVTLLHPIAPIGAEKVREELGVDERLWSWEYIFEPLQFFFADGSAHRFAELPPKADFYEKPASQLAPSK